MPAYQVAGWTVTVVLLAMACAFLSVTVALIVKRCVPSPASSRAGTLNLLNPEASVRALPVARSALL